MIGLIKQMFCVHKWMFNISDKPYLFCPKCKKTKYVNTADYEVQ